MFVTSKAVSCSVGNRSSVYRAVFAGFVLLFTSVAIGQENVTATGSLIDNEISDVPKGTRAGKSLAAATSSGKAGSYFRGGKLVIREGNEPYVMLGNPLRFSAELTPVAAIQDAAEQVPFEVIMHAVIVNESTGKVCWETTCKTSSVTGPDQARGLGFGYGPSNRLDRRPLGSPCRFDVGDFTLICFVVGQIGKERPVLLSYERTSMHVEENTNRFAVLQQLDEAPRLQHFGHDEAIAQVLYQISADDEVAQRIADLDLRPKQLDLTNARLTPKGVALLARIPGLRWVRFRGSTIDDTCLTALLSMKDLEVLDLKGTAVSADGVQALRDGHPAAIIQSDYDAEEFARD